MLRYTLLTLKKQPKNTAFTFLSSAVARAIQSNDPDAAIKAVRDAIAAPSNDATMKIPASALSSALFACERAGRYQDAVALAAEVEAKNLVSYDEKTLSTLQRCMCAVGDVDGATRTLQASLRLGLPVKRRSVASLVALYAKSFSTTSHGLHLLQLCRARGVELRAADVGSFAQVFANARIQQQMQQQNATTATITKQDVANEVTQLIRQLADHTPILDEKEQEDVAGITAALKIAGFDNSEPVDCDISLETGTCSNCGLKLTSAPLTASDAQQLRHDIESSLIEEACTRKPQRANAIRASFAAFEAFVAKKQPDVLLDCANLGFYGLSSWYSEAKRELLEMRGVKDNSDNSNKVVNFDFTAMQKSGKPIDVPPNLEFVQRAFLEMEARGFKAPLVILHERHLEEKNILPRYEPIVEEWRRNNAVFATVSGLNDDLAWLYAVVAHECFVLTNDTMRDHHFQLLSRNAFLRLRERRRIGFTAKFCKDTRTTTFTPQFPPPFSTFIQRSHGERNGETKCAWHVPLRAAVAADDADDEDGVVKWKCFEKK